MSPAFSNSIIVDSFKKTEIINSNSSEDPMTEQNQQLQQEQPMSLPHPIHPFQESQQDVQQQQQQYVEQQQQQPEESVDLQQTGQPTFVALPEQSADMAPQMPNATPNAQPPTYHQNQIHHLQMNGGVLPSRQTVEYDASGPVGVVDAFLLSVLRTPKDRAFLLKSDADLEQFILDPSRTRIEYPPMNSYQRLIVHRLAQYFGLAHIVDKTKTAVIVFKTPQTIIPSNRLADVEVEMVQEPFMPMPMANGMPVYEGAAGMDANGMPRRPYYKGGRGRNYYNNNNNGSVNGDASVNGYADTDETRSIASVSSATSTSSYRKMYHQQYQTWQEGNGLHKGHKSSRMGGYVRPPFRNNNGQNTYNNTNSVNGSTTSTPSSPTSSVASSSTGSSFTPRHHRQGSHRNSSSTRGGYRPNSRVNGMGNGRYRNNNHHHHNLHQPMADMNGLPLGHMPPHPMMGMMHPYQYGYPIPNPHGPPPLPHLMGPPYGPPGAEFAAGYYDYNGEWIAAPPPGMMIPHPGMTMEGAEGIVGEDGQVLKDGTQAELDANGVYVDANGIGAQDGSEETLKTSNFSSTEETQKDGEEAATKTSEEDGTNPELAAHGHYYPPPYGHPHFIPPGHFYPPPPNGEFYPHPPPPGAMPPPPPGMAFPPNANGSPLPSPLYFRPMPFPPPPHGMQQLLHTGAESELDGLNESIHTVVDGESVDAVAASASLHEDAALAMFGDASSQKIMNGKMLDDVHLENLANGVQNMGI